MQKQKRKTNHIHRAACALLAGLALSLGLFDWDAARTAARSWWERRMKRVIPARK